MEDRERTDVTIRFGVFEVDPRSGELRKAGVRIRVQDQPYKVLLALLEKPGEVVSREELKARIWPKESFGDFDHAVNVAVGKLRTALGDSAAVPRYVETLHRRGYRFVFPVEPAGGQQSVGVEESTKVVASDSQRRGRAWMWTAGLLTIVALGVAGFLVYRGRSKLTDKSRIVLGDFANTTGDAVFDGALRQGLEVQLEQSPFLSLLSRTEMEQTLQMMKQPADAKLTLAIAREICERTQSAAVLDGSIAQIGTTYSLIIKAENCANGETLASTQAEASDKNHVLESLGKASSEIRKKLGESLASVKRYDTPLEHATTSSLDALKAYDLGYQAGENGDYAAAIPFFERATALDPKFAMAYTLLGMMRANLHNDHNDPEALENLKRGFDLRAEATERERFYIEFEYYTATDNPEGENSQRVVEVWMQTYPRDCAAHGEAGFLYAGIGQLEKSLAALKEQQRLCPADRLGAAGLVTAYIVLDRFVEARAALDQAESKGLDSFELRKARYRLAFLENDATGRAEQVKYAMGKVGLEDDLLSQEADTAAYFGHLKKARELIRQAVDSARRAKEDDNAITYANESATIEALFGNREETRKQVSSAMRLPLADKEAYWTGLPCAIIGDETCAEPSYRKVENSRDAVARETMLPIFSALLAVHRKEGEKAAEMVRGTKRYDLRFNYFLAYVRGLVFLATKKASEAESDFQKVLEHRGLVWNSPAGALAHLQMGRTYAMKGDAAKARTAYEDFLTLWKDADPDIPILKEAKAEYAKLQ